MLLISGIVVCVTAFFCWHKQYYIIFKCGVETEATIVDIKKLVLSGGTAYYAIFSYRVSGTEYETVSPHPKFRPSFNIGEVVRIRYLETDPEKIMEVKNMLQTSLFCSIFLLLGIGLILFYVALG